jgi:hypothetical protein
VNGVNIKHYSSSGCRNGYGICTNINVSTCCKDDTGAWGFASASIAPLQYFDIGVVYEESNGRRCGRIRDSQNGPITCLSPANTVGLDGAAWFNCIGCAQGELGHSKRDPTQHADFLDDFAVGQPSKCTDTVSHDKLVLSDGHMFHIGKDMPAEVKHELYRHTFSGSTIELLHQDLLIHEVDHAGVQKRAEENAMMKM